MSITLIAVVIALVIGHTMPALVALRRYDWFIRLLEWLAAQLGENAGWRGAFALAFGLMQIALRGDLYGFPSFVFSLLILFYAWGPRDLDHDVEAVVVAGDTDARRIAAARLFPDREGASLDGGSLVENALLSEFERETNGELRWVLANALRTAMPYHRRRKYPEIRRVLKGSPVQ